MLGAQNQASYVFHMSCHIVFIFISYVWKLKFECRLRVMPLTMHNPKVALANPPIPRRGIIDATRSRSPKSVRHHCQSATPPHALPTTLGSVGDGFDLAQGRIN